MRGGLDPAAVSAMLAGDDYVMDVRTDETDALELGISFVIVCVLGQGRLRAGRRPPAGRSSRR